MAHYAPLRCALFAKSFLCLFIALGLLSACHAKDISSDAQSSGEYAVTAALKPSVNHVYYSGTLQPLQVYTVSSPVDGIVTELFFNYGDIVSKNQMLLNINSSKSQQDFATAITNYIKDKDQYMRNRTSFEGTEALYKAQIIDKQDFLSEKSQLQTSQLAYINSTQALKVFLKKNPTAPQNIEALSLGDVSHLQKILSQPLTKIAMMAPRGGIVLMPDKEGSGGDDTMLGGKAVGEGSEVKENQVLLGIGNIQGISTTISVSENDVNAIRVGQPTLLTSPALPGMLFYGKVANVGRQAKSSPNAMATFNVKIVVPEITPLQRSLIRIGMTTKVDITIEAPPQIKVPIQAVTIINGQTFVTVKDEKSDKTRQVPVETGTTDMNEVAILKGLNPGDKVIVRDTTAASS
ncbi:MAG: hypothetical protein QM752_03715 [Gammaproteobacteria bacterium]